MAYPGEYRREQILGEDGYPGEYDNRRSGYPTQAGYGAPGYGGQGYESRPYGGEGYEHHRHGHHLRPGYEQEGVYVQPTQDSDLGMGITGGVRRVPVGEATYVEPGYGVGQAGYGGAGYGGAGYGGAGYGAQTAYGGGGYENEELRKERRREHEAEAAAAAATAYALHERHERREGLQGDGYGGGSYEPQEQRRKHHFFGL